MKIIIRHGIPMIATRVFNNGMNVDMKKKGIKPMMIEARELYLYAINNGDLYRQQRESIERNLQRKFDKGVYDSEKAATLWLRFADNAAQKYHKEFCGNGKWFGMFNIDARREVATLMESEHHSEMKCVRETV